MNRVDHMIKYLSGDLTREESIAFEKELAEDKQLCDTFEEVAAAYRLISEQLRLRDEALFRSKLREVMDRSSPGKDPGFRIHRFRWVLIIPVAASLALLLAILMMNREPDRTYLAFFNPFEDPVILAYNQETRGDSGSAVTLFTRGQFEACLEKTSELLFRDPGNQLALLYHLLAALELDKESDVLGLVAAAEKDTGHALGQSLTWYQALAMVKAGQNDSAVVLLETLLEQPGPYLPDAHKLQKMLTK